MCIRDRPKKCLSTSCINSCTHQCRHLGNKAADGRLDKTIPCQIPQRTAHSWTGQQWAQLCPVMPSGCSWCPLQAQPVRLPRKGTRGKGTLIRNTRHRMENAIWKQVKSPTWSHITTVLHRIYPLLYSSILNLEIMWHMTLRLLPTSTPVWLLHNTRNRKWVQACSQTSS